LGNHDFDFRPNCPAPGLSRNHQHSMAHEAPKDARGQERNTLVVAVVAIPQLALVSPSAHPDSGVTETHAWS
jgi:hypothetical protein